MGWCNQLNGSLELDTSLPYLVIPAQAGIEVAGGRPAAGYFLSRGQNRSSQIKGRPVRRHFLVSLCFSTRPAPAELTHRSFPGMRDLRVQALPMATVVWFDSPRRNPGLVCAARAPPKGSETELPQPVGNGGCRNGVNCR